MAWVAVGASVVGAMMPTYDGSGEWKQKTEHDEASRRINDVLKASGQGGTCNCPNCGGPNPRVAGVCSWYGSGVRNG